jgi:hypothetical protein
MSPRAFARGAMLLAIGWSVLPVAGHAAESTHTELNLAACRHSQGRADEDYGRWRCPGFAGVAVVVTAGDQRSQVSYGRRAAAEPAARQTLAAFNGLGNRIEWRFDRAAHGAAAPFATILRWTTTVAAGDAQERGEVLVVTRLPPGPVCHVGYVDARANPDAETLARTIADAQANRFRCGTDKPVILGKTGPGFSGPAGD